MCCAIQRRVGAASGATQQSSPAPLSLSVSADQKWLAVGFFDHTVLVYDADNGFACTRQLKVHKDGVLCVRWLDAHGKRLAVGCANGNLQIIDL
jgi:WD40 repeat protein